MRGRVIAEIEALILREAQAGAAMAAVPTVARTAAAAGWVVAAWVAAEWAAGVAGNAITGGLTAKTAAVILAINCAFSTT